MRGTIISVHEFGATARLDDGSLAAIPAAEFAAHRAVYTASRNGRKPLELYVVRIGRHASAALVAGAMPTTDELLAQAPGHEERDELPTHTDIAFEMKLGAYLRETEAWAPPDRPDPAQRHFIRKKHRAGVFEARNRTT
jgi:hypothetical protein